MNEIRLKNYRCFRDEQTARLAPLTLLVGENSTGKTSFMAMIRALWDIAYRRRVPNFKEDPYDLGSFEEIAHHRGGRVGRIKVFEAGFDATPRHEKNMTIQDASYRLEITFGKNGTTPVITRRRLSRNDTWIEDCVERNQPRQIRFGTPSKAWKYQTSSASQITQDVEYDMIYSFFVLYRRLKSAVKDRETNQALVPLEDYGLPCEKDWSLIRDLGYFDHFEMPTSHEGPQAYASAPVRSKPRRTYDPARSTRDPEGDYVPMYLANLYSQNINAWTALKNQLEDFGKAAGLFDEISIKPLGKRESAPFQVQVKKFGGKLKGPPRNLIDVGYGVSQALPIITELLRPDAPPMFLLQQPEVHLHPSAQAALGSLFCQVAHKHRQLVVETHSDHLLDRVRIDVRDGKTKLKPDDVSILFFERSGLDVHIHSLRVDEEGNILDAPASYRSFFMEETTRSLGL